jgi:hypothetical protein
MTTRRDTAKQADVDGAARRRAHPRSFVRSRTPEEIVEKLAAMATKPPTSPWGRERGERAGAR